MSTGKESDKELAKQYKSRKFYIVKVIDRDNEGDGPKFWRFKHNYKNEGILDKIIPIWRNKGDITDVFQDTTRDRKVVSIVKVDDVIAAHRLDITTDYDRIKQLGYVSFRTPESTVEHLIKSF